MYNCFLYYTIYNFEVNNSNNFYHFDSTQTPEEHTPLHSFCLRFLKFKDTIHQSTAKTIKQPNKTNKKP